jgi:hypothetical protein
MTGGIIIGGGGLKELDTLEKVDFQNFTLLQTITMLLNPI